MQFLKGRHSWPFALLLSTSMSPVPTVYPHALLEWLAYPTFLLAGNRWHIDCFRCNTCHTLLDSDANLLLLGDGSLICNNCTYSCSACNNKIEDLAILTGDQAFCASCFCCRNCKNKIENLRYARTSQGIFCMDCHESLMSKRRKTRNKQKQKAGTSLNKSLPELPPQSTFSSDGQETPPSEMEIKLDAVDTHSTLGAPPVKAEPSSKNIPRDVFPVTMGDSKGKSILCSIKHSGSCSHFFQIPLLYQQARMKVLLQLQRAPHSRLQPRLTAPTITMASLYLLCSILTPLRGHHPECPTAGTSLKPLNLQQ